MKARLRRALVVMGYLAVFWGALPMALWAVGGAFDRGLELPPPPAIARTGGAGLGVLGMGLLASAMLQLIRRGLGLPISHLPPTKLVASGLYTRMRHPIYVSFTLTWMGLTLALGSWGRALGAGAVLTVGWVFYAVVFEEPRLRARFGDAYSHYSKRTGLVVPWPRRKRSTGTHRLDRQ